MSNGQEFVPIEVIAGRIQVVRGQRVLLDRDLAELYGVETKRFNEQVKRNPGRFPVDFMFTLTEQEVKDLRSQFATSSAGHGGARYLPHAFTEHGAIMAASVLNSPRAVELSVYVVRAFVQMRDVLAAQPDLAARVSTLEKRADVQDSALRGVLHAVSQLKAPTK